MKPFLFKTSKKSKNEVSKKANFGNASLYYTLCPFASGENWNLKEKISSSSSALPV